MSDYPEADAVVRTVFAAIRAVVGGVESENQSNREKVAELIGELVVRRGLDAGTLATVMLAEAAASGLQGYAEEVGAPVGSVLDRYEEQVQSEVDFDVYMAEEFPSGPPSARAADGTPSDDGTPADAGHANAGHANAGHGDATSRHLHNGMGGPRPRVATGRA